MLTATYTHPVISAVTDLTRTVNTVSNLAALVILILGAIAGVYFLPRAFKARDALARLEEKDRTISTHEQTIVALTGRIDTLEQDVRACRELAEGAQKEAATWRARYEEQARYTAEPALIEVRDAIRSLESTTATALSAQGELVMKSNELLAKLPSSYGFREDDRPQ